MQGLFEDLPDMVYHTPKKPGGSTQRDGVALYNHERGVLEVSASSRLSYSGGFGWVRCLLSDSYRIRIRNGTCSCN